MRKPRRTERILLFCFFLLTFFSGCSDPDRKGEAKSRSIFILSTREYSIAVEAWQEDMDIPVMYLVRYILNGELKEIPTYSVEERDGLIEFLTNLRL